MLFARQNFRLLLLLPKIAARDIRQRLSSFEGASTTVATPSQNLATHLCHTANQGKGSQHQCSQDLQLNQARERDAVPCRPPARAFHFAKLCLDYPARKATRELRSSSRCTLNLPCTDTCSSRCRVASPPAPHDLDRFTSSPNTGRGHLTFAGC